MILVCVSDSGTGNTARDNEDPGHETERDPVGAPQCHRHSFASVPAPAGMRFIAGMIDGLTHVPADPSRPSPFDTRCRAGCHRPRGRASSLPGGCSWRAPSRWPRADRARCLLPGRRAGQPAIRAAVQPCRSSTSFPLILCAASSSNASLTWLSRSVLPMATPRRPSASALSALASAASRISSESRSPP